MTVNALFKYLAEKRELPSKEYFEILKASIGERVKQRKEKLVKIPAGFYKGLKYKLDIVITGQYRDIAVQAQTMFAALQAITVDPTLLSDPTKKKFFYQWLEAGGINPTDFEPEVKIPTIDRLVGGEQMEMPTQRRGGGGVSAPPVVPQQLGQGAEQTL